MDKITGFDKAFYWGPLYKKNSEGKIERWSVMVDGNLLRMRYGEYEGKLIVKEETIKEGKNLGKANETTAHQQAVKEAESKYKKKLKSGYVTSLEDAKAGKTDDIIEGGVLPMLAQKFEDHKHKIKYPVYVQPKLDGHRCVAIFDKNGKVTLWTRTRKPIKSVPHIVDELERMNQKNLVLDGELYNHDMTFEEITSAAKKQSLASERLFYCVYDAVSDATYETREAFLNSLSFYYKTLSINFVPSCRADNEEDIIRLHERFVGKGYEGAMVRQLRDGYEHKRTTQLLKVKAWQDAEFPIAKVNMGANDTVVFVCMCPNGTFGATMSGEKASNQKYLEDESLWKGKKLTVKFFRLSAEGIPMFPTGLRIREDL